MENELIKEFPISVYGNFEKYNDTISKARCRIFYKYDNRNGSYITDEFADKLIATLPYTPVKGIYSSNNGDYTDHGQTRDLGKIYGIVPENPNFAWETHLDEDGVEREYACADVYIYTALYGESSEIISKPQSMELYGPSIKGNWELINGKKFFVFTDACFLGLQVLGSQTEPCFEGAGFFTLFDDLDKISEAIDSFTKLYRNSNNGGHTQMKHVFFKLSDNQKYEALCTILNPNYNEDGGWTMNYIVCDVYDEYAICRNCETGDFERVYYVKDDASDSLSVSKKEKCYIIDVTEEERTALEMARKLNKCTYEKIDSVFETNEALSVEINSLKETLTEANANLETANAEIEKLTTQSEAFSANIDALTEQLEAQKLVTAEYEQKKVEYESENATLQSDNVELTKQIVSAKDVYAALEEETIALRTFKYETEKAEKEAIIDRYAEQLDEDVLATYKQNVDEFTAQSLEMKLAYEFVQAHPTVFNKTAPIKVPKDTADEGGIIAILSKYKN